MRRELVFQRTLFFVLVVCLGVSLPVLGQRITGDIAGDVTDSTGAVVPNVTVTAVNTGTNLSRSGVTSATGAFRIPELPIGTYRVTASAEGFKSAVQTAEVQAGAVIQASFKLTVGQRTETIEVEGTAPLVELSPNNNNYVDNEKIENVPLNGRDFNSLLAITPGVQRTPGGGFQAISINGSKVESNNYFIDGLYNNDRYYGDSAIGETGIVGIPAVLFPPEAIEELSIQETPSAEFGVKGGAPILLNMKSGTNVWHGSGTWVNHSGFGDASNYFSQGQKTPIHNNQFNATIGGPIIKDKAFMFLFYEGQRYKSLAVSSRFVPTPDEIQGAIDDITGKGLTVDPVGQALLNFFPTDPSGVIIAQSPTTASANTFGVKFDYRLNDKNSLAVRYILGDSLQSAPPFAGLPPGPGQPADLFNSVAPSRAQMAGVSLSSNFGTNKILESRVGFTRFAQLLGIQNKIDPKSLGMDTGPLSPADFGVPYVYLLPLGYGGYIGGVQAYPITTRPDQTWDWSEHFSWVKGDHTVKFGGNFQRAYTNSLRNNARTGMLLGYFSYYTSISGDPIQDSIEELLLGKADNANRAFGDTHRHLVQNSVGFYLQDDWKIKPRLTLSFGLRYDIFGNLRDRENVAANFFPAVGLVQVGQGINRLYHVDYKDFGPRVGFAWDIFGNGKTALRGGYSLTYDVPNFATLASPYSLAGASAGAFTQPNLGLFSVSISGDVGLGGGSGLPPDQADNIPGSGCFDPVTGAGDYICFSQGPVFGPSPTGEPPFDAYSVVQNFKTPRAHNYSLSIQQEIARNNVLTVGYSGQRGQDLAINRDLNASPLGSGGDLSDRPFFNQFPNLRHIVQTTNLGDSQYDSLQASYNQRDWHGLDTEYNFTWSKCFDENSFNRGGTGDYPQLQNPLSIADNRGLCDHDVRLNFNVSGVYSLPTLPHMNERLGKGWQLSTIFTAISGRPFSVLLGGGADPSGQGLSGSSIRASWDGTPVKYNTRNPAQYIVENLTVEDQLDPCGRVGADDPDNPGHFLGGQPLSPFFVPCPGTVGNSRRNQLIGPGLAQWDMTLMKNTKITERLNLELRWEVYNILNRGNFYYFPDNTFGASFGTVTKTSDVASGNPVIAQGGPRNMNFSLKFTF
ncbi:MAG: TonB-dependent receptor [Acidobacteriia bacterium]|nr:TonB-dependent receptor [Terriglobia bacterium]